MENDHLIQLADDWRIVLADADAYPDETVGRALCARYDEEEEFARTFANDLIDEKIAEEIVRRRGYGDDDDAYEWLRDDRLLVIDGDVVPLPQLPDREGAVANVQATVLGLGLDAFEGTDNFALDMALDVARRETSKRLALAPIQTPRSTRLLRPLRAARRIRSVRRQRSVRSGCPSSRSTKDPPEPPLVPLLTGGAR